MIVPTTVACPDYDPAKLSLRNLVFSSYIACFARIIRMSLTSLPDEIASTTNHDPRGCPLCGESGRPWLTVPGDWRRPTVEERYQLNWCAGCDFGFLAPRPTLDELPAFYDLESYYTHARPQAVEGNRALSDRVRQHLAWRSDRGVEAEIEARSLQRYGIAPGARVLDVGCGNGGLLSRLDRAGYRVTGVEPDAAARAVVTQLGLEVHAGTAERLPDTLADERFDAITLTHVLEHCLDPRTAVISARALLSERGVLVIETPNNAAQGLRQLGAAWRWLDVPRHVNFFTAESLARVCRAAGLTIERIEYTGYARQFGSEWLADEQTAWDCLHRRADANCSLPPRNNGARSWRLLAATWLAAPARKYDSVRIVSRAEDATA